MVSCLSILRSGPVVALALVIGLLGKAASSSTPVSATPPQGRFAQAMDLDHLPATRSVTVLVEGEPQVVEMQLFWNAEVPLVTYYPRTMTADQACDTDGCGVSFTDETTGAGMVFLFPAGATQASAVAPFITGPEGLLAENEWVITGTYTEQLDFPWARQMVTFQTPGLAATGLVYLAEANGHGFAAMAVFPPEAGDGFMPQVNAILAETQVKP